MRPGKSRADVASSAGLQPDFPPRPVWDAARRELWFAGQLIKKFHTPASSQETILSSFQEDGWPPRIDDPLTLVRGKSAKRRLHDAINCLNRAHQVALIRFHGDGTGEGIYWATE